MPGATPNSSQYGGVPATFSGSAVLDTAIKKFGAAALKMTAGYATLADDSRFTFSGDFTIEAWVNYATTPVANEAAFSFGGGGSQQYEVFRNATNKMCFFYGGNTVVGTTTLAAGTWYHVALTRSGSTVTFWVNGVSQGTTTLSGTVSRGNIILGAWNRNSSLAMEEPMNGSLDEFRVTNGVARYTAGFTPPTAAFGESVADDPSWNSVVALLHCDTAVPSFSAASVRGNPIPLARVQMDARAFHLATPAVKLRDMYYDGNGRISGTTKVKGTPNYAVRRRVRLFGDVDGLLRREQWSDPVTGAYSFDHIDRSKRYTVVTYDHEHNFRAVIADNLTPDLMP